MINLDKKSQEFENSLECVLFEERKETAAHILLELLKSCDYTFGINGKPIIALDSNFVFNIAKFYGVNIKEKDL